MADAPDVDKLKADLKKLQADIAKLSKQAADAQAAVKAAEAQLAEIAKATAGYDKVAAQMQQELDDDEKLIAKKRAQAEAELKTLKGELDKAIQAFDKDLADQGKAVASAVDKAVKANAAADKAEQDVKDKQAALAALKGKPAATASKLADIKALLKEVTKAETKDDSVAMYFFAAEAASVADALTVPTADAFEAEIVDAQAAIETAKDTASTKKADAAKAKATATAASKKQAAALASRRVDLLKALREVKPPPGP
jgi:chromosome segregation ATPase